MSKKHQPPPSVDRLFLQCGHCLPGEAPPPRRAPPISPSRTQRPCLRRPSADIDCGQATLSSTVFSEKKPGSPQNKPDHAAFGFVIRKTKYYRASAIILTELRCPALCTALYQSWPYNPYRTA